MRFVDLIFGNIRGHWTYTTSINRMVNVNISIEIKEEIVEILLIKELKNFTNVVACRGFFFFLIRH